MANYSSTNNSWKGQEFHLKTKLRTAQLFLANSFRHWGMTETRFQAVSLIVRNHCLFLPTLIQVWKRPLVSVTVSKISLFIKPTDALKKSYGTFQLTHVKVVGCFPTSLRHKRWKHPYNLCQKNQTWKSSFRIYYFEGLILVMVLFLFFIRKTLSAQLFTRYSAGLALRRSTDFAVFLHSHLNI